MSEDTLKADKVQEIVDLDWKETSGVAHAANLTEGWLVMKSGDVEAKLDPQNLTDELLSILKAEEAIVKTQERLYACLQSASFSKAPKDVQEAVVVMTGWLKSEGYGKTKKSESESSETDTLKAKKQEEEEEESEGESKEEQVQKIPKKKLLAAIQEAIKQVFGRMKTIKAEDYTTEAMKKCFIDNGAWEEFCKATADIIKSEDTAGNKAIEVGKRVDTLEAAVSKVSAEKGFYEKAEEIGCAYRDSTAPMGDEWVVEVYDDHLIVGAKNKYLKVKYRKTDSGYEFDRDKAEEVQRTYIKV